MKTYNKTQGKRISDVNDDVTTRTPPDRDSAKGRRERYARQKWLEGYEWALAHLADPGVLADARKLAMRGKDLEPNDLGIIE